MALTNLKIEKEKPMIFDLEHTGDLPPELDWLKNKPRGKFAPKIDALLRKYGHLSFQQIAVGLFRENGVAVSRPQIVNTLTHMLKCKTIAVIAIPGGKENDIYSGMIKAIN